MSQQIILHHFKLKKINETQRIHPGTPFGMKQPLPVPWDKMFNYEGLHRVKLRLDFEVAQIIAKKILKSFELENLGRMATPAYKGGAPIPGDKVLLQQGHILLQPCLFALLKPIRLYLSQKLNKYKNSIKAERKNL